MDRFSFGPRDDGIIQIAYTVADIQEGMRRYTDLLHVGPWFLVGPFVPPQGVYRGATTRMKVSLALAFAGQVMVELIEQHDEEPSVFRETLKARGAHGFHHWAIGARDFEKAVGAIQIARIPGGILGPRPDGISRRLFRHLARPAGHA
jgi:hypothetical protein